MLQFCFGGRFMTTKRTVSFKENELYLLEFAKTQMMGNLSVYIKSLIKEDMDRKKNINKK